MIRLQQTLSSLAARRPVFHSEADFQHELALEIRTLYPTVSVRLEVPRRPIGEIDLILRQGATQMLIELKFKTRGSRFTWQEEEFWLHTQAATPLGRYDALKDIARIEQSGLPGLAIFLTNEPSYWSGTPSRGNGSEFSLHESRKLSGCTLKWADVRPGSVGALRLEPISLKGTYTFNWANYSTVAGHDFRYLATKVESSEANGAKG